MAFDTFMEFVGSPASSSGKVVGESQDKAHPGTVQLLSFQFGIENPVQIGSASAGAGAGKATFSTIQIVKGVDSTSASLFAASGSGAFFPQVNLFLRKPNAPTDYVIYRFKMVIVSKMSWSSASGDAQPEETLELTAGAMQVSYPLLPNGQPNPTAIVESWSRVTNRPDFTVPGVP